MVGIICKLSIWYLWNNKKILIPIFNELIKSTPFLSNTFDLSYMKSLSKKKSPYVETVWQTKLTSN